VGIKNWFKKLNEPTVNEFAFLENEHLNVQTPTAGDNPSAFEQASTPAPKKPRKPRAKKSKKVAEDLAQVHNIVPPVMTKEEANKKGEPWVTILSIDLDPANVGNGSFELDWNDIFVAKLIRAGYVGKTDQDIVDMWFRTICQNVVMETYEQEQADPDNRDEPRPRRKPLGGGRSEIS
jgi:hypothetical protein